MPTGPTEPTGGDRRDRQRLTVPEAATILGITVDAVRGRIRRGKLEAERVGSTVYVWVDAEESDRPRPSEASTGPIPDESRLVEVLENQVEDLRIRLDREQEANRENRRIIAGLTQRIPELPPASPPPSSPDAPGGRMSDAVGEPGTDTPPASTSPQTGAQARRPWWRKVFGG